MHFAIVSYVFPPSKEIGGRRWAKFSQQLTKQGHEVTVITTDISADKEWCKSEFPGVKFKFLPKKYPDWLTGETSSVFEKILYKITSSFISPLTKKNLFDKGIGWKTGMLGALEKTHQTNPIDTLVVTGAPFSLLAYGAEFKKRNQEVFFVGDLRDPWTWGNYYGIPSMSSLKKKYQEKSELTTLSTCDMFCYPTENMGDFLKEKYPQFSSKCCLLPHAFEPEKFPVQSSSIERKGFIYGGSLYNGIEGYVEKLYAILRENSNSEFKWDIYTRTIFPLIDAHSDVKEIVKHPLIPEEELFKRMNESAAYLAFFPVQEKDLISTKFFEIIYTGTPILYVGEEGEVGNFIRQNKLGVHILPENMERDLPRYLDGNIPFERDYFNVMQYTFESVTKRFVADILRYKLKN